MRSICLYLPSTDVQVFLPQKLPVKRPDIPESLLKMKDDGPEEEEEEEEMEEEEEGDAVKCKASNPEMKTTREEEMGQETTAAGASPRSTENVERPQHGKPLLWFFP